MASRESVGKHPYAWIPMADGPACWGCGRIMTECAPGTVYDTWHCTNSDCDVTQRTKKKGLTGA